MPLFDPERHEPLTETTWNAAGVEHTIRELVSDAERCFDPESFWPLHPTDNEAPGQKQTSTYMGAAGVLLALRHLSLAAEIPVGIDLVEASERVWQAYQVSPDVGHDVPSLYLGALGVLLVRAALGHLDTLDLIEERIRENADNPTREQLWGAPGTMLVAYHLARQCQEQSERERWKAAYLHSARQLISDWHAEPDGVFGWVQDLYGSRSRYLGAAHGTAGNLFSLLLGAEWLTDNERALLLDRAQNFLLRRAQVEDGAANWPPVSGSGKWLAQWCHGAPGVVTSLRPFPVHYSNRVEQKLVEAGNLIWRAGPLVKGPSLCHGTAGNGYAFLQLFERSGDQLWLDRARSFAMHTIEQIARRRAKYHSHHFSLFTGDYGAAWFLSDCLHLRVDFPLLESIE